MLVAEAWVVASTTPEEQEAVALFVPPLLDTAEDEEMEDSDEDMDPSTSWMPHTVLCFPSMTLQVAPPWPSWENPNGEF